MITIAICTYQNAAILDLTLSSLCGLNVPSDLEYEILVVDNNCTDNTSQVVAGYLERLINLRVVKESKQGLSHARNRALEEAEGEIVSFIDDDVKVDPGWLAAVANAFDKYGAAMVGGKSYLIYPCDKPEWFSDRFEIMLSRLDYGDDVLVGTEKDLFGLNYSVNKQVALNAGGFDSKLGRIGKKLSSGEEKDLQNKITINGGVVVYEPKAIVYHIVPIERMTQKWFLRRCYQGTLSLRRLERINGGTNRAMHFLKRTIRCYLGIIKSVLIRDCNPHDFFFKKSCSEKKFCFFSW